MASVSGEACTKLLRITLRNFKIIIDKNNRDNYSFPIYLHLNILSLQNLFILKVLRIFLSEKLKMEEKF